MIGNWVCSLLFLPLNKTIILKTMKRNSSKDRKSFSRKKGAKKRTLLATIFTFYNKEYRPIRVDKSGNIDTYQDTITNTFGIIQDEWLQVNATSKKNRHWTSFLVQRARSKNSTAPWLLQNNFTKNDGTRKQHKYLNGTIRMRASFTPKTQSTQDCMESLWERESREIKAQRAFQSQSRNKRGTSSPYQRRIEKSEKRNETSYQKIDGHRNFTFGLNSKLNNKISGWYSAYWLGETFQMEISDLALKVSRQLFDKCYFREKRND